MADGSDILGPPSISIASGTGIVTAGTGLLSQPGSIDFSVPAGVAVEQVLIYWEGIGTPADDTIVVNSTEVTGSQIGVSSPNGISRTCYRADITNNGWVTPGSNSLTVEGLNFGQANDGAGVLVIIDDGSGVAEIEVRDGCDFAYWALSPPYDTTVPKTFTFGLADFDRTATLDMFFSSVSGSASGGVFAQAPSRSPSTGEQPFTTISLTATTAKSGIPFRVSLLISLPTLGCSQLRPYQ